MTTVLKIVVDPQAAASTRLRAADIVLERTAKAIELEDIEARVAALEEAQPGNRADEGRGQKDLRPRRAA